VPPVARFGQGVEGVQGGTMRESIRGEQGVEGERGATAVVIFFTRGRVGIGGVWYRAGAGARWRWSKGGGVRPRPMGGALADSGPASSRVGGERERERKIVGPRGPARGKENWAGPEETVRLFDLFKLTSIENDLIRPKDGLPQFKIFEIKYSCEEN
jgi:hypothetical protein